MSDKKILFQTLRKLKTICDAIDLDNPVAQDIINTYNTVLDYVRENHYADYVQEGKLEQNPPEPHYRHIN